jgi:hypothetical protein
MRRRAVVQRGRLLGCLRFVFVFVVGVVSIADVIQQQRVIFQQLPWLNVVWADIVNIVIRCNRVIILVRVVIGRFGQQFLSHVQQRKHGLNGHSDVSYLKRRDKLQRVLRIVQLIIKLIIR